MRESRDSFMMFKNSTVTRTDTLELSRTNTEHKTSKTKDITEMQFNTGELSAATETDETVRTMVSSPLALPAEIMLQILSDALKLPNGIHSDRWSTIKQARVDKFSLLNKEMSTLIPEAFFTSNKVVLKPVPRLPDCAGIVSRYHYITCPNSEQRKFMQELEFRPHMWSHCISPPKYEKSYLAHQVAWLEKLASGSLGFARLDTLCIVLDNDKHCPAVNEHILQFISHIEDVGPLTFSVQSLKIVVDGHSCSEGNCAYKQMRCTKMHHCQPSSRCNEGTCSKHDQLSKLLLVKSRGK
ncbi:hypothetical protein DE146DRAFT_652744 [Phaeosphaeria sp. MPI-PUGE-AT-0046c]|nr:hypothetical protein DE146DRAFT_652744 [Phaeosphaeria sp. MPI-PUGE-AT-0046c]